MQHDVMLDMMQTSFFIDLVINHVPVRMSIKTKSFLPDINIPLAPDEVCLD